ncbi:MAG: phosphatase PAP2 family protein [Thermodesulfovibrionales bacterium]
MRRLIFGLRPADTITILFLIFLSAVVIFNYQDIPEASFLLTAYLTLITIQLIIIRFKDLGNIMGIFHDLIFPTMCIMIVFDSLGELVHYVNPKDIDHILIKLDYIIFNGYPTVILEKIMSPLLTDIMQIAYTTYYFIPVVFGALLLLNKQRDEFDKTLFLVLFCFYLSFIGYLLMPAIGPRFTIDHLQSKDIQGLFVTRQIQDILNTLEGIKRDAFPSGHTAIPLVILYCAYRFKKVFFWISLPVVIALIFSTVYCRYHYVVDVIAGFALAVLTIVFGERYYKCWLSKMES